MGLSFSLQKQILDKKTCATVMDPAIVGIYCMESKVKQRQLHLLKKQRVWQFGNTLPKTKIAPKNGGFQVRNLLFQWSIFSGELLVSGRV